MATLDLGILNRKLQTAARMSARQIVCRTVGVCFGQAAEHHLTDRVMNMPYPFWAAPHAWKGISADQGSSMIKALHEDGVAILPDFFDAAAIERIHRAINDMFANPGRVPDLSFRDEERFYASVQVLSISPDLAEGAIDPDLLNIVGGYFRRTPFLSETDFRRVMPHDMSELSAANAKFAKGYTSSHWHHDLRGRQVKVQIYLGDVGPGDQNFAFVAGSHRGFKSSVLANSRFSDAEIETPANRIIECYGRAGTAILFNSNGIHRLRRGRSQIRDTVTYYYHPARMYRATSHHVHPESLSKYRNRFAALTDLAADVRNWMCP